MSEPPVSLVPGLVDRFGALKGAVETALEALGASPESAVDMGRFVRAQKDAVEILREVTAMQDGTVLGDQAVATLEPSPT
jgi:hypothetical protein